MAKVQAQMSTEIALDLLKASESVKSITTLVNSATKEWKAQEAQLKSTGDYLGAAQAKYEGLGNAIEAQQSKIEALKNKQSALEGNTKETAEAYLKFQNQIDQATTRLASMESQQERAKSAVELQKSGILQLNDTIKAQSDLMSATVRKYEAQNDAVSASKTKIEGLTSINEKYQDALEKEQTLLESVKNTQGESSNAYTTQAVRVENLKTKIAENNNELSEERSKLSESAPGSFFSSLKEKLLGVSEASEKTTSALSRIKEYFVGNVLANGFYALSEKVKELASSGYEAAESATLVKERMEGIGLSENDIESLTTQIKELKENTNMSADSVNKLQMRFYDNTHSIETAKTLTKGVASLEDQLKLTSSQSDSFSTSLNRIESSGTVTLSSLGKLEKSAPGFSTAFQKASGMSTSAFDSLVNSGKMTSSQFNDILAKASKNYKSNSATFNTTSEGAMHKLTQTWKDTQQSLMTPLVSVSAAGLTEISKVLSSPAMQKSITQLGQGIASLATKTTSLIAYLGKHQKDISSIVDSLMQIVKLIAVGAWNTFKGVLTGLANAFNTLTGNANKTKDPLKSVASLFSSLTKHETTLKVLGGLMVTAFASKTVLSGIHSTTQAIVNMKNDYDTLRTGLGKVKTAITEFSLSQTLATAKTKLLTAASKAQAVAQKALNVVMNANPYTKIIIAITAVIAILAVLYTHNKKFRDFVNGIISWCKEFATGIVKWFKQGIDATVKVIQGFWNTSKPLFSAGFDVLKDYTKVFSDVFTGKWGDLGTDVKKTINDLISFWKKVFTSGFNWLNDLTGGRLGDVLNTFSSIFNKIKTVVSDAIDSVHHSFVDIVRGIIKPFNSLLDGLKKGINWILDKVGASKITANWSIDLPNYANGTGGILKDQLAMVNDGAGSNYREMYRTPDGQVGMFPATRNMIVPLKAGTEILNGEDSAQLASLMNIQAYASGTVSNFFNGIINTGKNILESTEKILAQPAEFVKEIFAKFTGSISASSGLASDIITNLPNTIANSAVNWIKSLFGGTGDAGGSLSNPTGASVTRWTSYVIKALSANGLSTSSDMVAKVLKQISTESGGNPNAIQGNIGDINNRTGDLAKGLMQTISTTFNAYKFAGHGDIFNGYDNLLAALNYAKHKYGSNLSALGKGHGYEDGGIVSQHGFYEVAEHNMPEAIIPLASIKQAAATQVLDKISSKIADETDTSTTSTSSTDVSELSDKLSSMISLMKQQIQTTKSTAFNKNDLYKVSGSDQNIANFQALGT